MTDTPPPPPPPSPPTIAIFGATGNLARHLITTFLSPTHTHATPASASSPQPRLVLFTRRDTPATRRWAAHPRVHLVRWGVNTIPSQSSDFASKSDDAAHAHAHADAHDNGMSAENIARRLREERVDAVVNALPPGAGALREEVARGVALAALGLERETGRGRGRVRVYFPPEFGLDARVGADGGGGKGTAGVDGGGVEELEGLGASPFDVPEWEAKSSHFEAAKAMLGTVGVSICRIHCGLFMHAAVGPWLGFHTARGVYSVVGSSSARTVCTDLGDVARAIAVVVQRACAGGDVPENLRLAGCVASVEEVREAMMDAGAGDVEIRSVPLEAYRERMLGRRYEDRSPIPYIKLIVASGLADWRPESDGGWGNDNELVNPGASLWRWKSIRELAGETKGRPNASA